MVAETATPYTLLHDWTTAHIRRLTLNATTAKARELAEQGHSPACAASRALLYSQGYRDGARELLDLLVEHGVVRLV